MFTGMKLSPIVAAIFLICSLLSCGKQDCNCVPLPTVKAAENTWRLDDLVIRASGRTTHLRDGRAHIYTIIADSPAANPSTLRFRFNADPATTSQFRIIPPQMTDDSLTVSIVAFRGSDSVNFRSVTGDRTLTSYHNDRFELTWIDSHIPLQSDTSAISLSFSVSE